MQLYMRELLGSGPDVPRRGELGEQPGPEEVPEQWTGFLRLEVTADVEEHGQQQAGLETSLGGHIGDSLE